MKQPISDTKSTKIALMVDRALTTEYICIEEYKSLTSIHADEKDRTWSRIAEKIDTLANSGRPSKCFVTPEIVAILVALFKQPQTESWQCCSIYHPSSQTKFLCKDSSLSQSQVKTLVELCENEVTKPLMKETFFVEVARTTKKSGASFNSGCPWIWFARGVASQNINNSLSEADKEVRSCEKLSSILFQSKMNENDKVQKLLKRFHTVTSVLSPDERMKVMKLLAVDVNNGSGAAPIVVYTEISTEIEKLKNSTTCHKDVTEELVTQRRGKPEQRGVRQEALTFQITNGDYRASYWTWIYNYLKLNEVAAKAPQLEELMHALFQTSKSINRANRVSKGGTSENDKKEAHKHDRFKLATTVNAKNLIDILVNLTWGQNFKSPRALARGLLAQLSNTTVSAQDVFARDGFMCCYKTAKKLREFFSDVHEKIVLPAVFQYIKEKRVPINMWADNLALLSRVKNGIANSGVVRCFETISRGVIFLEPFEGNINTTKPLTPAFTVDRHDAFTERVMANYENVEFNHYTGSKPVFKFTDKFLPTSSEKHFSSLDMINDTQEPGTFGNQYQQVEKVWKHLWNQVSDREGQKAEPPFVASSVDEAGQTVLEKLKVLAKLGKLDGVGQEELKRFIMQKIIALIAPFHVEGALTMSAMANCEDLTTFYGGALKIMGESKFDEFAKSALATKATTLSKLTKSQLWKDFPLAEHLQQPTSSYSKKQLIDYIIQKELTKNDFSKKKRARDSETEDEDNDEVEEEVEEEGEGENEEQKAEKRSESVEASLKINTGRRHHFFRLLNHAVMQSIDEMREMVVSAYIDAKNITPLPMEQYTEAHKFCEVLKWLDDEHPQAAYFWQIIFVEIPLMVGTFVSLEEGDMNPLLQNMHLISNLLAYNKKPKIAANVAAFAVCMESLREEQPDVLKYLAENCLKVFCDEQVEQYNALVTRDVSARHFEEGAIKEKANTIQLLSALTSKLGGETAEQVQAKKEAHESEKQKNVGLRQREKYKETIDTLAIFIKDRLVTSLGEKDEIQELLTIKDITRVNKFEEGKRLLKDICSKLEKRLALPIRPPSEKKDKDGVDCVTFAGNKRQKMTDEDVTAMEAPSKSKKKKENEPVTLTEEEVRLAEKAEDDDDETWNPSDSEEDLSDLNSEDGSSASSDSESEDVREPLRKGLRTQLVKKKGNEDDIDEEDLDRWQDLGAF